MKSIRIGLACAGALVLLGIGTGCEEDKLHCCMVQRICDVCICSTSAEDIGDSGNEAACEEWLDNGEHGCGYINETDALAYCS